MPNPTNTVPQLQPMGAGTLSASPSYPNYISASPQYGVDMPMQSPYTEASTDLSWLGSVVPVFGGLLGAMGNMGIAEWENQRNEELYRRYNTPQARMAQMKAAGINPAAAAEGISGASSPAITAATPSNAMSGIAELLGNSVNSGLTAGLIKSETEKNKSQSDLTKSLNVNQNIQNKYADAMQNATLRNLVNQGDISRHTANIIAVDDYYKGAEAAAHYEQSIMTIKQMSAELQNTQQQYFNMLAEEYATMMHGQLSEAQIHKVFSDIGLNNAQIEKIAHEVDNIDASTMSIVQDISESKSRERVNRAQAWYQEKVNATWNNSGWNMNSDVNANFHRLCMEGNKDDANKLLLATKAVIYNQGEARAKSKDFLIEKAVDVLSMFSRLAGGVSGIK